MSILTLAVVVGVLFAAGTFLILRRSPIKLILGLGLLSHGVNLLLFSTSGLKRAEPPILDKSDFKGVIDSNMIDGFVDPLPQALILTAIVISFGVTAFTVVLVNRRNTLDRIMYPEIAGVPSTKAVDPFVEDEQQAWRGLDEDPDDYEWLEYSLRDDDRWKRAQEKMNQMKLQREQDEREQDEREQDERESSARADAENNTPATDGETTE